ncbi:purine-binding chemotaxis protein CheW [Lysobacter sp. K5869]|uniref:chemotaxis protein CheW n=1 Tax=Lysobacter sp. K5869 TaxID=2820808 RepID=UPI001C061461|nr:chemotaxis protein CheW [Lysobacter sp. K5869]QWP76686.1 purine-binding chemotaxis protein CheW [Lysobacter sp. K5869]
MLFLIFQLDAERYAIDAATVAAVLPRVEVRRLPQAHDAVVGVFDYRGEVVPVIDLCRLALGRPAREVMSTRIVLADYTDRAGAQRRLGLLAERVVDTVRLQAEDFAPSGVDQPQARYLGPVARDAHGLVQRIGVRELLPDAVHDLLFQQAAHA